MRSTIVPILLCTGCEAGRGAALVPYDGPGILSATLEREAEATAPLLWTLDLSADEPVTLDVRWTDGAHEVEVAFDERATDHRRRLIGFRAGQTYDVVVTATAADGRSTTRAIGTIEAEPAPTWFPEAELVADPERVAPGHTMLALRTTLSGAPHRDLVAVYDEEGYLCHWVQDQGTVRDASEPVPGEPLLVLIGDGQNTDVAELSWAGEVVRRWSVGPVSNGAGIHVPVDQEQLEIHHDVSLIDDDLIAIGRAPREISAYPLSYVVEDLTGPATISDDMLIRFSRAGELEYVISLTALLPVTRIGFDSLTTNSSGELDWGHTNAVLSDPADGGLIVSLRNQDAIVKLQTDEEGHAEVDWILGNHQNWTPALEDNLLEPIGEVGWPFHQHGPNLVSSDGRFTRLVVFDNGAHRDVPFNDDEPAEPEISRVVSYTIDARERTVVQDWAFIDTSVGRLFSIATGNATVLENGNILADYGFLTSFGGQTNQERHLGATAVRLIEFDPRTLDEVWHLSLSTPAQANSQGWYSYRAYRIPSLYGRVLD